MNSTDLISRARAAYALLIKLASYLQSPLLLVLRLYWGWSFFGTGRGKLGDLDKVTGFFESLNIPLPHLNAIIAGSSECFGGLLLLVGLASRLISIQLAFIMVIAYVTADREALQMLFSDPDKFTGATPSSSCSPASSCSLSVPASSRSITCWQRNLAPRPKPLLHDLTASPQLKHFCPRGHRMTRSHAGRNQKTNH